MFPLARTLSRPVTRFTKQAIQQQRNMSAGGSTAAEVEKWSYISGGMVVLTTLLTLKTMLLDDEHHSETPENLPDYMKIRSKPFPWECSDCGPFQTKCWDDCKAAKSA